jgi:hypothetical protein
MKKLYAIIGMAGAILVPNVYASYDGVINITATAGASSAPGGGTAYQFGNGGEFTAVTTTLGTFQTFCLEVNEDIGWGTGTYNYQINSGAVNGGGDAHATDELPGPGYLHPMDNISIGTAWLYSQFRAGNLNINSTTAAGDLQDAIWYLEGETSSWTGDGYGGDGSAFLAAAAHGTSTSLSIAEGTPGSIFNDSEGAYGVVALNLYTQSGDFAQDQLAMVPEPTTMISGVLLLLPFGASTLRILRRNRAA